MSARRLERNVKTPLAVGGKGCGATADIVEAASQFPLPFRLIKVARVNFGAKQAEATIEIDGLGQMDCDLFIPDDRASFVTAKSIRSKYTGAYERTVRLDAEFAAEVLYAIEARLLYDSNGGDAS